MEEPILEERVNTLEQVLNRFIIQSDKAIAQLAINISKLQYELKDFKDEMKDFKDEMKDFKDEMKDFKIEVSRQIKSMNKQWGDLANKMGTIIEDIIAPGVRPVCSQYFGEEVYDIFTRVRRKIKKTGQHGEIDIICLSDNYAFIVEVKSSPNKEDLLQAIKNLEIFRNLFPEWATPQRKLIPILGGIYFDNPTLLSEANAMGVLLLTYREWEFLDFINFNESMLKA